MNEFNSVTRLLMTAVHLYPDDFISAVKERVMHPYKASAPEHGVNMAAVYEELESAKRSRFKKSAFLLTVFILVFIIFIFNPEKNWGILLVGFMLGAAGEFFFSRSIMKKIRRILGSHASKADREGDVDNFSSDQINVIISGGYSPFIGAGIDLNSWSFTVDLKEPSDKNKPVNGVTPLELHGAIKNRLLRLNMAEMTISDELFVHGRDVSLLPHLFPQPGSGKPVANVNSQYVTSRINSNNKLERHYRVVRIPMWGGQILLSMYYRLLVIGDKLFCEVRFFMLPPLDQKYLRINSIPEQETNQEIAHSIFRSIISAPISMIAVLIKVLEYLQGGFASERKWLRQLKKQRNSDRLYNYGWNYSLREKWSSPLYERYFQQVDKDFSLKLMTSELLAGLLDCLSEKNISIDQFMQTSTKIINEGVLISGGSLTTESLAIGKKSKITNITNK